MLADVAEVHGAEQSIDHGMDENVTITVSDGPSVVINFDTAKDKRLPPLESVSVPSLSNP